jgi:hypothetical protein
LNEAGDGSVRRGLRRLSLLRRCVGGPRAGTCDWFEQPSVALDLTEAADQRHWNGDARAAEELAIRYADAARGHRSGAFAGADDYRRTRDQCLAVFRFCFIAAAVRRRANSY